MAFLFIHPTGKEIKDRMMLKIPVIKGIVEYALLERFCRILGTMLRSGVAIPSAMETTTEATANIVYREQLEIATAADARGQRVHAAADRHRAVPRCRPSDVQGR